MQELLARTMIVSHRHLFRFAKSQPLHFTCALLLAVSSHPSFIFSPSPYHRLCAVPTQYGAVHASELCPSCPKRNLLLAIFTPAASLSPATPSKMRDAR